ncbi:MAG: hypothetical protein K2M34_05200 [Alphaproteobacteria bacterium]|nr:hypothetical protein [Alphaproteobacteria bacterium]
MKQILVFALFVIMFMPHASFAEIPSVDFVDDKVSTLSDVVDTKADNAAVVHLTGDEMIAGTKTFAGNVHMNNLNANTDGAVTLTNAVVSTSNDNQVATTAWTNSRVTAAKGEIPVGGKDSTVFTKIWIEE